MSGTFLGARGKAINETDPPNLCLRGTYILLKSGNSSLALGTKHNSDIANNQPAGLSGAHVISFDLNSVLCEFGASS